MPVLDWSATAAWIALIVAIASPVITALINNRHARKLKELEIFHARRFESISNYLEAAGTVAINPTEETISAYGKAYGNAVIYFPPELFDESEKFEINGYGELDFKRLARKFVEHGFGTKQKLW